MNEKALIAMSGGVDSSVAAYLMKRDGFDCTGATMKLFNNEAIGVSRENTCCSLEDVDDARSVALSLGIPYFVFNFTNDFKEQVIGRFIEAYQNGATPNPCIDCNRFMKFEKLLHRAKQLDIDYIVTGHYAQVEYNSAGGRYILKKSVDETKDQSYVLYAMTQEQLAHTLLPLGGLRKSEVRAVAAEQGFINAKKHDSQDICFVRSGGYADFIRQYTGYEYPTGRFIDTDGNDIGEHKGIIHYTVGQRKGLGLSAPESLYVCSVCAGNNTVTVGAENSLYAKTLTARDINFIPFGELDAPLKVRAKIRYKQQEQPATVWQLDDDTIRVEFDSPQRAITKGQAIVLYDGDTVIGGGTINEVM
jgi:tRNA-specific 2-thiouridylase